MRRRRRPLGGDVDLPTGRQARRRGGLLDDTGIDMAGASGLGRQQHDEALVEELRQAVDHEVDEVVVAVAVPEQHPVRAVVEVLVLELGPDDVLEPEPQVVVDVVVIAELLDDLPLGKSELAEGRRSRGLAHCHRSSRSRGCGSVSWREQVPRHQCTGSDAIAQGRLRRAHNAPRRARRAAAPGERTAWTAPLPQRAGPEL